MYQTDPRLTCETSWEDSIPGYTYWKGICFEHLGHSGIGNWIEMYPSWIKETVQKMEHYEQLGIDIQTGYYHNHWFQDLKKGNNVEFWEYFKENLSEFYLRGEDEIAFPQEIEVLTGDKTKHAWEETYDLFIWNKQTCQWIIEQHHVISPDVVYNDLVKKGWSFGTLFWGGYSRPQKDGIGWEQYPPYCLWDRTREQLQECFRHYKLPEVLPEGLRD